NYLFKPLPVIDREAIGILNAILAKLQELKDALTGKLDQLKASIEKIYTVTPETQTKFDNALDQLQSKVPTEQLKDEFNTVKDLMDNSATTISNTQQENTF